jgi:hypothetical protein
LLVCSLPWSYDGKAREEMDQEAGAMPPVFLPLPLSSTIDSADDPLLEGEKHAA